MVINIYIIRLLNEVIKSKFLRIIWKDFRNFEIVWFFVVCSYVIFWWCVILFRLVLFRELMNNVRLDVIRFEGRCCWILVGEECLIYLKRFFELGDYIYCCY